MPGSELEQNPIGAEGTVVVEVLVKLHVREQDWAGEHGVNIQDPDYERDEWVGEWFVDELRNYHAVSDEWPNVEMIERG